LSHFASSKVPAQAKFGTLERLKRDKSAAKLKKPDRDALSCFAFSDDYSFGILQSGIHWSWFIATCSKLKGDFRYTPESVFDTFPWPQKPKHEDIKAVAEAAVKAAGVATGDDEEVELLAAAASYFSSRVFCLAAACRAFVWIAADSRHG
jgi:hypothetical protein